MLKSRRQTEADRPVEFNEVYQQFLRPLYAFIAWRVNHRESAEDLTSLVFEKAWRAWPDYDSKRAGISTWLFSIARNTVADYFRGAIKKREFLFHESDRALEQISGAGGQSEEEPLNMLVAGERRSELAMAMLKLDDREKEILFLKFGSEMTNRQISRLLEISESNVGTILYRSLKKLKSQLEGGIKND